MASVYLRKGSPYFQASILVGGDRRRVSTEETNRRKAEKKADDLEKLENLKLEQSRGMKFSDAAARFLKVKPLKPKTIEGYTSSFTNVFGVLGEFPLASLTEDDLTRYVNNRMQNPKTGTVAIRRDLAFLSTLYTTARHWEPLIKKMNPAKEYDKSGIPDAVAREVWLKESEAQRLLDAVNQPYQMVFILLALYTGMRKREVLNLRWDEIDLHGKEIVLDNLAEKRTKSGKSRLIPLNDLLVDTLRVTMEHSVSEYVFYNPRTKKPFTTFKTFWKNLRDRVGLKNLHIHDLRHTFASWGKQAGMDEVTLMDIMGQKTRSMVKRYSHSSRESLHDGARKLDRVTLSVTRPSDLQKGRSAAAA